MGRDIRTILSGQLGNHNSNGPSGAGGSQQGQQGTMETMAQNSATVGNCSGGGNGGPAASITKTIGPDGHKSKGPRCP